MASTSPAQPTPTTQDAVLEKVANEVSTMNQEGIDFTPVLAEEVRLREAVVLPPQLAAAAQDEKADEYVLVENLSTRVWHRTSYKLKSGSLQEASAMCGWKFGATNRQSRLGPWSDLPRDPFRLCSRCLPSQRVEALKSLNLHVSGMMES
jgi:hypothetical protein